MHLVLLYTCITSLVLWSFIHDRDQESIAKILQSLFTMCFLVLLFSIFLSNENLSLTIFHLAKDLLIVSISAFLAQKLRSNKIALLMFAGILYVLIPQIHKVQPETPKTIQTDIADDAEFLLEFKSELSADRIKEIEEKTAGSLSIAFAPKDKSYNMDEYYILDIKDNSQIDKTIQILKTIKEIRWVEKNEILKTPELETKKEKSYFKKKYFDDPEVAKQWSVKTLDYAAVHATLKKIKPKKTALVAVLDGGVYGIHEDLKDNYVSTKASYDKDSNSHGTHCAGVIAAISNNGKGISSMVPDNSWVKITSIKVMNNFGFGTQQQIIKGIIEAADLGADVISMSIGGVSSQIREKAYSDAIEYANAKGTIVVVASGNSNVNARKSTPGNAKGVIGVAAIDTLLKKSHFSNTMEDIEMPLSAPGTDIYSTVVNNKYKTMTGTSMAAPHVAASVALLKAIDPSISTERAFKILRDTGKKSDNTKLTGKIIQPNLAIKKLIEGRSIFN